jgi:hypothetical protein
MVATCCLFAAASGLFLGTFGPHGPEVLSLSRSISLDSGEEELLGLKLTGDPNVPAGEVRFTVDGSRGVGCGVLGLRGSSARRTRVL